MNFFVIGLFALWIIAAGPEGTGQTQPQTLVCEGPAPAFIDSAGRLHTEQRPDCSMHESFMEESLRHLGELPKDYGNEDKSPDQIQDPFDLIKKNTTPTGTDNR